MIIDDELIKKINIECREQLQFSEEIDRIIQSKLVCKINSYIDNVRTDEQKSTICKAITFLICQGIRTYNSSVILIRNGYAINALVNLRALVEITIEIEYILTDNKETIYKKALEYLDFNKNDRLSVRKKAINSLNETSLYKAYSMLCEHAHGNSNALHKNIIENVISTGPNDVLINETFLFSNSLLYNFIEIICKFYELDISDLMKGIYVPNNIKKYTLICFNNESVKTDKIITHIFNEFFPNIQSSELQMIKKDFYEYTNKK